MRETALFITMLAAAGCGDGSTGADMNAPADLGASDLETASRDLAMAAAPDLAECAGTPDSCGPAGACTQCPTGANMVATCTSGACGLACAPNITRCGEMCVDTMTDGMNCASCGRNCFGGSCSAGVCGPGLLGEVAPDVRGIALDATNVYVTSYDAANGGVFWLPQAGGKVPQMIAQNQAGPIGIAVDKDFVYWTNRDGGTVMKAPNPATGGMGKPVVVAMNQAQPIDVAVDATNIYWVNSGDGTVMAVPLAGGKAPAAIASGQDGPSHIALDKDNVYWTNEPGGTVMQLSKMNGVPIQIANGQNHPAGLAVDAANVYWADTGDGAIRSAKIGGGGNPTTLASAQNAPTSVTLDANAIYWTDYADGVNNCAVMRLGRNAAMSSVIGGPPFANGPRVIANTADSVYYADHLGDVYRIVK